MNQLLTDRKCRKVGILEGKEVWVTPPPDNLIIRLPPTGAIHLYIVEIVCLESLGMNMWDYDYFLGQIGVSPKLN